MSWRHFGVVISGGVRLLQASSGKRSGMPLNILPYTREPSEQNYPTPDVNSTKAEKPWNRMITSVPSGPENHWGLLKGLTDWLGLEEVLSRFEALEGDASEHRRCFLATECPPIPAGDC